MAGFCSDSALGMALSFGQGWAVAPSCCCCLGARASLAQPGGREWAGRVLRAHPALPGTPFPVPGCDTSPVPMPSLPRSISACVRGAGIPSPSPSPPPPLHREGPAPPPRHSLSTLRAQTSLPAAKIFPISASPFSCSCLGFVQVTALRGARRFYKSASLYCLKGTKIDSPISFY